MKYLVISFSHKNTDIATREKLSFINSEQKEQFLRELLEHRYINEALILSTCNRIEIFASVKEIMESSNEIFRLLNKHSKLSIEELEGRADIFSETGAIHHIFAVASSLDSLVVGETQISGQLKDAFKFAFSLGFCGQKLSRVMHFAFKCSAEVRNVTDISKNPISVASTAVVKLKDILGNIGGESALVVGAGEMSVLATKHLVNSGCNVILINRDLDKAKDVAKDLGELVSVEPFSKIKELINRYKILITATGAPHIVITKDMIENRNFKRYWFDLALPRDIEECECENIELFLIDDLKEIVMKNLSLREEQAQKAYSIVGRYTMEFFKWLDSLSIEPLIKEIRNQAKDASLKEVKRAISKGFIPKEYEENLIKVLHNAFNTFLHTPTKNIKNIADEPLADSILESLKVVFDISSDVKLLNKYKCEHAEEHK